MDTKFPNIATMSDDELKDYLSKIRLKRKQGYERPIKKQGQSKHSKEPDPFVGLNDEMKLQIIKKIEDELKEREKDNV